MTEAARGFGPFTTLVTLRSGDGVRTVWNSRHLRKRAGAAEVAHVSRVARTTRPGASLVRPTASAGRGARGVWPGRPPELPECDGHEQDMNIR